MTRHPLPATAAPADRPISLFAARWQMSLLAAAAAAALGGASIDAHALALGRLNVQSALGEPLRAEIDVTEISAAEAEGLQVGLASREAFQAAGVAYNEALANVRSALQRRADGRYVVRLTGSRPLNEPFVDLLLEANWASGRIVRDYTLLLDPPVTRQAQAEPVAPAGPQIAPAPRAARSTAPDESAARRARAAQAAASAPAQAPAPVRAESSGEQ